MYITQRLNKQITPFLFKHVRLGPRIKATILEEEEEEKRKKKKKTRLDHT